MAWTVTIDNGSTFTDGCLLADGKVWNVKVLTTPYDLMRCFVDVFRNLARVAGFAGEDDLLRRVEEVRYSTTSGTNALLVRQGVRVGLVVGPDAAANLYGLRDRAPALIDALVGDRVVGLHFGEMSGSQLDDEIFQCTRELLARGAQWLVVSLPEGWGMEGEREFKRRYMKLVPGHLLGAVPVLFSRELCADPDDERRTATSLLNGFLHRETARFLYHADGWVRDRHVVQPLRIMRNDGACGRVAKTTAVKTLDSGPMGGLSGAAALAQLCGLDRVVTVDVGGTSTDIGLVEKQKPIVDLFGSVHGLPLSFSFPALRTAALGGGSVFRVRDGTVTIGPDSAGALPGPACFGRGGEDPTLTDAAVLAGYLDASRFAGGSITLQPELAARVITKRIAEPLGLKGAADGAWAMIDAFAEHLAFEIRAVLQKRSWPAEASTLVVYGGSGPLLACLAAERVGLRRLVIPPASASFSALGVGFAELAHEYRALLDFPLHNGRWEQTLDALHQRASRDIFGEGVNSSRCLAWRRLRGDGFDLDCDLGGSSELPPGVSDGRGGRVVLDHRLTVQDSALRDFPVPERGPKPEVAPTRKVLLGGKTVAVPVVQTAGLAPGAKGKGPCMIESAYWSALLPKGWSWEETLLGIQLSR